MRRLLFSIGRIFAGVVAGVGISFGALFWVLRQPTLGSSGSAADGAAGPARLREHVEMLSSFAPRSVDHPEKLRESAAYIETEFSRFVPDVSQQFYRARGGEYSNVIASLGPRTDRCIVVGAHYDSFALTGSNPGADDNASGVAGLLELARSLSEEPLGRRVDLVAYSTEEPPFFATRWMGSAEHARASDCSIDGVVVLEMIGYYADEQPSTHWLLDLLYPKHGRFVGVVGRWQDRRLARWVKRGMRSQSSIPVYSLTGPFGAGLEASDPLSYWRAGISAVMVTDTAVRNPNYHTARDLPDTLDYDAMAQVVGGVGRAVVELSRD